MDKFTKAFPSDVTVIDGERAVVAKISTVAVDREGDVLIPQGCNSKNFEKNPLVYFNHEYYGAPRTLMGQCVAIKREDDAIIAKTVFATRPETYPEDQEWLPDTIFSLYQQKVIRAFSVGFEGKEMRPATDRDVSKYGAGCKRVFSKWEMFEYSVAPLPMQQEALTLCVSKGLMKQKTAEAFGWDKKAIGHKCPGCGKATAESEVCDECAAKPKAVRVVASVELKAPMPEPVKVHRVHIHLDPSPVQQSSAVIVRRLVLAEVSKRRGHLYAE